MKLKQQIKDTDLLIIDADGTLGPHLTVGLANQVALFYIVRLINKDFKIKQKKILNTKQNLLEILKNIKKFNPSFCLHDYYMVFKIILNGILLHATKWVSDLLFNLGITQNYSNSLLIKLYLFVMKGVNLNDFVYTADELKKNAYPGVFELIKKFKKETSYP